jgi:ABC-type phosphate/phosphonate transport system ATPase subunit
MLSLDQVAVTFPSGITALHPTSLTFVPGQFKVLIGASGAGKSTLLRCLNGLVRPTQGEVLAGGYSIFASARTLRRDRCRTGMIFQQHHLIDRLTAHPMVLQGNLDPALKEAIRKAFLDLKDPAILKAFRAEGFVATDDSACDILRDTARVLDLDLTKLNG